MRRYSPRLSGLALRALAAASQTRAGGAVAKTSFRKDLGISELEKLPDAFRGPFPLDAFPVQARPPRQAEDAGLGAPRPAGAWPRTSAFLAEAYARGEASPVDVALRAFAAARRLGGGSPPMNPLLEGALDEPGAREAAEASAARYREGRPLGPLDGVPVVVKEETAIRGLPRRLGTSALPESPLPEDAAVVARLREAGAVILGHTPMTEFGMSPIGVNPKRRMPENAHASGFAAGGSSTGSGVAVALGLCPLAVSADGGGSTRIPASLNGVFGLKPTFGRVSREGDGFGGTVNHIGPIGASAEDLALFLEAAGAPDPRDPLSRLSPPFEPGLLRRALGRGVRGLVVAIVESEWEDAEPEVARAGMAALRALEHDGARLVSRRLDLARHAAAIGYVTFGMENYADTRDVRRDRLHELGLDLRSTYGVLSAFTAAEFVDAQRLRSGLRRDVARLLQEADLLGLPTTVAGAPAVTRAEMEEGLADARALDGLCRFAFLGNLTGLPASTSPAGADARGLPVGVQLVGDAWDEATVLAATAHLERTGAAEVQRPSLGVDLLGP